MTRIGTHYYVRAQQKVGRQNIGRMIAIAYTFGDKKQVIAKMKALYPHARIAANAYVFGREANIRATHRQLYPHAKEVIL